VAGCLEIGIVDLLTPRPSASPYTRLIAPNFTTVMPQVVGVWAERLGHRVHYEIYTGRERLDRLAPADVDLLFVSAFTSAAPLAAELARLYRARGAVTVLGGPHARAYPEAAASHFDYVVGLCDEPLLRDLLAAPAPQPGGGVLLAAAAQPQDLPGVRERWRFVRHQLRRSDLYGSVSMLGSMGCPYTCSFCIDARIPYRPLPYDTIREDLAFLERALPRPIVAWHDPNFGVRFDEYMDVLETATSRPGVVRFACESSLSILGRERLERLRRCGCVGVVVGIESWNDFDRKAGLRHAKAADKMPAVAEQVHEITRFLPYTQANFVLGTDADQGPEPFALTKAFIDRAPAAYPAFSLLTAFGRTAPLSEQLAREARVLEVPFALQDCASLHNVVLRSYPAGEFYARAADLLRYAYGPRTTWRRFQANPGSLGAPFRWAGLVRSVSSRLRVRHYARLTRTIARDPAAAAFFTSPGTPLPPSLQ